LREARVAQPVAIGDGGSSSVPGGLDLLDKKHVGAELVPLVWKSAVNLSPYMSDASREAIILEYGQCESLPEFKRTFPMVRPSAACCCRLRVCAPVCASACNLPPAVCAPAACRLSPAACRLLPSRTHLDARTQCASLTLRLATFFSEQLSHVRSSAGLVPVGVTTLLSYAPHVLSSCRRDPVRGMPSQ